MIAGSLEYEGQTLTMVNAKGVSAESTAGGDELQGVIYPNRFSLSAQM